MTLAVVQVLTSSSWLAAAADSWSASVRQLLTSRLMSEMPRVSCVVSVSYVNLWKMHAGTSATLVTTELTISVSSAKLWICSWCRVENRKNLIFDGILVSAWLLCGIVQIRVIVKVVCVNFAKINHSFSLDCVETYAFPAVVDVRTRQSRPIAIPRPGRHTK